MSSSSADNSPKNGQSPLREYAALRQFELAVRVVSEAGVLEFNIQHSAAGGG